MLWLTRQESDTNPETKEWLNKTLFIWFLGLLLFYMNKVSESHPDLKREDINLQYGKHLEKLIII